MAKINIPFDNADYSVEESALSTAAANLKAHLQNVMNGSGAVINLDGAAYNVDSTKLNTIRNDFVTHLGTIAGSGRKVSVGGVEYNVDSNKLTTAVADLHTVLGGLHSGDGGNSGNSGATVTPKDDLSAYTWAEIQAIAQSDVNLDDYGIQIGDTIEYDGKTYYLVSDERSEAYGGLVFLFNSGMKTKMNSDNTNTGGYASSKMRSTVEDMYITLPTELQGVIKTVTVSCNDGKYEADGTTSVDYVNQNISARLFLPALKEVYVTNDSNQNRNDALNAEGSVFDWFAGNDARAKRILLSSSQWWVRSADNSRSDAFKNINDSGWIGNSSATFEYTVVPAFVIG